MWSEETLNETRSLLVGVNRTHPMISFLTMLGPSPDWCTGVSSQSVCQVDCTWVDRLDLDLYPWDAGVQTGDTYLPKDVIRKVRQDPYSISILIWIKGLHP
ncbi:unnamed protein product [Protopolystoma xenopodis]|uniref:Spondin domain-containing protein n=1 Tax=Protopolystoma xenopodis TaxID=117903 RepID=A0A448XJ57_9PLAT|nr:unnamed protein product [Protopolystoma xenopodis]